MSHFLVNQETISIPNVGVNITIDSNFIEVDNNRASFDHDYASNIMLSSLKLPFGLSLKHYPHIKAMLEEDPSLIPTANIMVKPNLADAAIKNYERVVKKFKSFSEDRSLEWPIFSDIAVVRFLAFLHKNNEKYSIFLKIISALKGFGNSIDVKVSALTPNVVQVKNSLLRSGAKSRPVVKKSNLFPITVLNELYKAVIKPHLSDEASINPSYFTSIVRGMTFYYTFCRFSDFVQLRDSDITDHGTYLRLNFRNSKNDQYFEGTHSIIVEQLENEACPVKIIRLYFKTFKLRFCDNSPTGNFLNFRYRNKNGLVEIVPCSTLGYSN